jgi:hypothetical protein
MAESLWPEEHRFAAPRLIGYFAAMDDVQPMTVEQAATLKRLTQAAYELDAQPYACRSGTAHRGIGR